MRLEAIRDCAQSWRTVNQISNPRSPALSPPSVHLNHMSRGSKCAVDI